ncbi:MAG: hypothetical protein ACREFE_14015 [Limisphaerales bacterium]
MTIKFHIQVETQGAVAVGSSAVLGFRELLIIALKHPTRNLPAHGYNNNTHNRLDAVSDGIGKGAQNDVGCHETFGFYRHANAANTTGYSPDTNIKAHNLDEHVCKLS